MIEVRGVYRSFNGGRVQALRGLDLEIQAGEFVAITGPSGSGKSTLLHLIGGLDRPTAGEIFFEGRPLSAHRDLAAYRSRTSGFVFQSFNLIPTLTAHENVQLPMFETGWPLAERRARAAALLERVGLADHLWQRPSELSGGERQRVAIARSLANEPRMVLADEPTGNLDSAAANDILTLLENIRRERGITLLVVTHSPEIAARAGRTVVLLDGRRVA